jgi:hypothetical protein
LVKAPKVYLRDTGLVHHLLNISSEEQLLSHPVRGCSGGPLLAQRSTWSSSAATSASGSKVKSARGDHPAP